MTQQVEALNRIIVHQAAQLADASVQLANMQAAAQHWKNVAEEQAKEIAALKEPKTDGSVSGKPPITHAQSLADLHGLPRPAADVTAEQFMRDNNIGMAANETPEPARA